MRSIKKKLLFICFSALIMVGLCIGVFADYDTSLDGSFYYTKPYNAGDVVMTIDYNPQTLPAGHYIFHFHVNSLPDHNQSIVMTNVSYSYYYTNGNLSVFYNIDHDLAMIPIDGDDYYIFVNYSSDLDFILASSNIYNDVPYISCEVFEINDEYTIDIYDNSHDVWASVASIVDDATDSVINNDILLMFAAAIPVLSFGVGMLIRLVHKS